MANPGTREHQAYPVLNAAQIASAQRFASGSARAFAAGEPVYAIGEKNVATWLVLDGTIEVARRDGLHDEAPSRRLAQGSSAARSTSLPVAPRSLPPVPGPKDAAPCPLTPPICGR
jgi:thioredoxin reductase (NADPH)